MEFFVGLHMPAQAHHFASCMISYNRLKTRRKPVPSKRWIMDSGAFTEVAMRGGFTTTPQTYAEVVNRLGDHGGMVAAVAQDWMCEPFVVSKTGLSVEEHQRRTVERYAILRDLTPHYIMPVIQGYRPEEYLAHIAQYGDLLGGGSWVGVGSVCKRSGSPDQIGEVLRAITGIRPDLRLHGFGVQLRALRSDLVRPLLATADSMAWSFNARREGRGPDANKWQEAMSYVNLVNAVVR